MEYCTYVIKKWKLKAPGTERTKASLQWRLTKVRPLQTQPPDRTTEGAEPLSNCREMLDERVQVQWSMRDDMVEVQLSARIREDQYVAFGLSGEQGR